VETLINVVFEKITFPLAQVMSIINSFLLKGIIGSLASQAKIFESFV
jgi:hypothetical protein